MRTGPYPWQLIDCQPRRDQVALYRFYDREGRVLYIGVSKCPRYRFNAHMRTLWWPAAYCYRTEIYPYMNAALDAERAAIKAERPIWNKRSAVKC